MSALTTRDSRDRRPTNPPPRVRYTTLASANAVSSAPMRQSSRHSSASTPTRNSALPSTWTTNRREEPGDGGTSPSIRSSSSPAPWSAWNAVVEGEHVRREVDAQRVRRAPAEVLGDVHLGHGRDLGQQRDREERAGDADEVVERRAG